MQQKLDQLQREATLGRSLLSIVLKAIFIALVGFGAPAGVTAAFAPMLSFASQGAANEFGSKRPRFFFGLTEGITCPRGSEIVYDEWYDGESTQFRVSCLDAGGGETRGRTQRNKEEAGQQVQPAFEIVAVMHRHAIIP